jgi:hypothetical protein
MPILKGYIIGIWFGGGSLLSTVTIDAHNKQQAKELGLEIAEVIAPLIDVHYAALGHTSRYKLKVIVHET